MASRKQVERKDWFLPFGVRLIRYPILDWAGYGSGVIIGITFEKNRNEWLFDIALGKRLYVLRKDLRK